MTTMSIQSKTAALESRTTRLQSRVRAMESEIAELRARVERSEIEAAVRRSEEQFARGEGIPLRQIVDAFRRKRPLAAK